jgi:hypothetical protein
MTRERGGQRAAETLRSQLKQSQLSGSLQEFVGTVQKNSMRRTADQVPLRLAEKKGSGMGSNKKVPHVLPVLLIFLLVTAMGVIFWTSGCTLKFQSAGGKDKAAICTIKCEPKAGFPACVARCTQDGKACDNGIRNCD